MPEKAKTYTVVKPFRDASGKQWKPDDDFPTDNAKAIQDALAAGQIEEDAPEDPAA